MLYLFNDLNLHTKILLLIALIFVLFYETINGFHDTANAVATVIYTRAIKYQLAVVIAAVFNFLGVILGGLSVAYSIVHMLPTYILINVGSNYNLIMVFSLLLSAIIWNLGTWYFGLPTSSSHTLIGSIIGVGLINAIINGYSTIEALNLPNVINILSSLIISPLIGLVIAGGLTFILRYYSKDLKNRLQINLNTLKDEKKDSKKKPPFWTRITLILSAIGVAFSHGANDGQKGIGLLMLILINIEPSGFIVNMNAHSYEIKCTRNAVINIEFYFQQHPDLFKKINNLDMNYTNSIDKIILSDKKLKENIKINENHYYLDSILFMLENVKKILFNIDNYNQLSFEQRSQIRCIMLYIADIIDNLIKIPEIKSNDQFLLKSLKNNMLNTIEYAPIWIIITVALALGAGTMIGWRRVAKTLGEKIGNKSMTYAQGLSAQITTAIFVGLASYLGIPVSTTHVLSSSLAGTIIVEGGGLQNKTISNILIAWIFTLPVSILLSSGLYLISFLIMKY